MVHKKASVASVGCKEAFRHGGNAVCKEGNAVCVGRIHLLTDNRHYCLYVN